MGNSLPKNICKGTIGELLVQLRLLEYGIQAAPPIKDSGNDLIAIKGEVVKFIQIKTTAGNNFKLSKLPKIYHIVAFVKFKSKDDNYLLDKSEIYLLEKNELEGIGNKTSVAAKKLSKYKLTQNKLNLLFKNMNGSMH